jgi:hypothetical protein
MHLSSQIPPVPVEVMPPSAQLVVTGVLAVLAVGALGFVASESRRTRSPLPVAVLVGGSLAVFNEPIVDVLGGCLHHQIGQWTAFTTFDRPMPIWLCLAYVLYVRTGPLAILRVMSLVGPRKGYSVAITGLLVFNVVLELPILNGAGLYRYYGYQALTLFGLPVAWVVGNVFGVALTVVVVHRLGPALSRGAGLLAALTLPAATQLASAGSVTLPEFSTYNADVSSTWKWVGALASLGLGLSLLRWLATLLPESSSAVAPARPAPVSS